jgi:16S rRNA pseudouridine516 synthase
MFAAVGNHVESLHRLSVGALALGDLAPGEWRPATPDDLAVVENRAPSNSP